MLILSDEAVINPDDELKLSLARLTDHYNKRKEPTDGYFLRGLDNPNSDMHLTHLIVCTLKMTKI